MSVSPTVAVVTLAGLVLGAAMALHAVLEILNALLDMLSGHICQGVLVAAVAGVFLVIVVDVTGGARRVVVAIEEEQLGMIECRGLPAVLLMALNTIASGLGMDTGLGRNMTGLAAIPG